MADLTQHEMAQFDAQEFAVIQQRDKIARQLEGFLLTAHRAYDRRRGYGSSRWMLTDAEVEAKLAEKAAGEDARDPSLRGRPSQLIEAIAGTRVVIAGLNAQIEELEDVYAGRWQRYFPCLNADGHVHASLRGCSTVRWDTDMGWATELSGLTLDEAINGTETMKGLGPRLCSVCFPQAPVELCQSLRDITRAERDAEREAKRLAREEAAAAKRARAEAREAAAAAKTGYRDTPQNRRLHAINAVGTKWNDVIETADREEVALDIEGLLALGRSQAWQDVVTAWAEQVRENENVKWAFIQWNIYACHAA